jgi:uncharacterized protein (DUF2141 family)
MLWNGEYAIKIVTDREGNTHLATYKMDGGHWTELPSKNDITNITSPKS